MASDPQHSSGSESGRRVAAVVALVIGPASLILAVVLAVQEFPQGLGVLALVGAAAVIGWYALIRRGWVRAVGLLLAVALLVIAILIVVNERALEIALVVGGLLLTAACAEAAVSRRATLSAATAPQHPVLIFNPKSGGGKAEKFSLATEAKARGIEAIELRLGEDLEEIVRGAVADGADGLAMAGGDGSQAIVAAVAAELDLPYACIPAGTRNHFALDLGVDRDDVVGALEAFGDGGRERRVDLAEVNGRVFVNNVSLGVYAEAVQRSGYRDAKLRTLLDTVPDALGPSGAGLDLRWTGPGGHEHRSGAVILVSNNRYRFGAVGSGTRPTIDDGLLGIAIAGAPGRPRRERAPPAADDAAVERPDVRGRRGRSGSRGYRRRGGATRSTAAIRHQARGSAGADRARASRCLAVRTASRQLHRRRPPAHADRSRQRITNKGELMDILEIEQKERLGREEVAARLHKLADMLARDNDIEFERGGMRFTVHVPDEVELKVELEIETDERELEIELKW